MDTETLTCGACGKPLAENGPSLYWCPPQPSLPEPQQCQYRWQAEQATDEAYQPPAWEQYTPVKAA